MVVHGGGPQITAHLDRLGIESAFTAGLRVTTPETMDVVRMVLVGQVNRDVVGLINDHGPFAVGLSGEDAHLFTAERKRAVVDGEPVDIGLVGDDRQRRPGDASRRCSTTAASRSSPASRAATRRRPVYNVNADTAAAALAVALGAEKLVVLTDVEGLYADWPQQRRGDQRARPPTSWRRCCRPCRRHGAEDGGLPARGPRRRAAGARARRPGAARDAARDLHRRGHRHHGDRDP